MRLWIDESEGDSEAEPMAPPKQAPVMALVWVLGSDALIVALVALCAGWYSTAWFAWALAGTCYLAARGTFYSKARLATSTT